MPLVPPPVHVILGTPPGVTPATLLVVMPATSPKPMLATSPKVVLATPPVEMQITSLKLTLGTPQGMMQTTPGMSLNDTRIDPKGDADNILSRQRRLHFLTSGLFPGHSGKHFVVRHPSALVVKFLYQ